MWTPFHFFIGAWQGTGEGRPGISRIERRYEFILNNRFLFVKSQSIYEPQEKNPKGEIHQDWGLFSYDKNREIFVLRQFHVEGFVNQYRLDRLGADGQTISFVSEVIENISPGWRAKETYRKLGTDEFIEIFELAAPDQGFEIYSESRLRRIRLE